jgi:hypothetical protein
MLTINQNGNKKACFMLTFMLFTKLAQYLNKSPMH